jgi:hypothetical protein
MTDLDAKAIATRELVRLASERNDATGCLEPFHVGRVDDNRLRLLRANTERFAACNELWEVCFEDCTVWIDGESSTTSVTRSL